MDLKKEFNKLLATLCPDSFIKKRQNSMFFWTSFVAIVPKLVTLEIGLSNRTERTLYPNVCLKKNRSKRSNVLLLWLLRFFLRQTLNLQMNYFSLVVANFENLYLECSAVIKRELFSDNFEYLTELDCCCIFTQF